MAFETVRYSPASSRVLAAGTIGVCAAGVVSMMVVRPEDALRYGWSLALVAVLAWAMFWHPRLIVQEHGITVVNVTRTEFVPWPALIAIDTRWALTLRTADSTVRVWASPASGRHRMFGLSRGDFAGVGETARGPHASLRPSDAISTPAGNLAQLIRGHWEGMAEDGLFEHGTDPEGIRTTWHAALLATVAALVVASTVGAMV